MSGAGIDPQRIVDVPGRAGDRWTLVVPTSVDAGTVAGWSRSATEAQAWCSRAEHPFPAVAVVSWWQSPDVRPWLLISPDGRPSGLRRAVGRRGGG